jgi:hypothetical protein
MVKKFLSLDPHDIDEHAWWYEEPAGITFVVEFHVPAGYVGTEFRTISWGSVRAALARRDREDMAKRGKRSTVGKSGEQK